MKIRTSRDDDVAAIAALFTASIHGLAGRHYDAAQRAAWAPQPPDLGEWRSRLDRRTTLVAEQDGTLIGFVSFEDDGHIDLLYTAPAAARKGVATALHRKAERRLVAAGVAELRTEASLVAMPLFERLGYEVVEEQNVSRRGVQFRRFAMAKRLPG